MRSSFLHVLSGMVLASVAVLAAACNHDTLSSGSQNLSMTYTPSPPGVGRFDSVESLFFVNKIQALPADPEQRKLYFDPPNGLNDRILFRFSPFQAKLALTAPVPYSQIALSAGTYDVTLIEFTPLVLVDPNLAPPPFVSCIDGISAFDAQSGNPGAVPETFVFNALGTPPDDLSGLNFTIQTGQTGLSLAVDIPGLIAAYQAAFEPGCVRCQNCALDPRSTLTTFDTEAFRTALLTNITIE